MADNPGYVSSSTEGANLHLEVRGADAASVRVTLDDLLACLGAAERSSGLGKVVEATASRRGRARRAPTSKAPDSG